jgi:hypothetical protein
MGYEGFMIAESAFEPANPARICNATLAERVVYAARRRAEKSPPNRGDRAGFGGESGGTRIQFDAPARWKFRAGVAVAQFRSWASCFWR